MWAWGYNSQYQLGDGTNVSSNVPVKVSGISNVKQVAAGGSFSIALKNDGTVWGWGINCFGQLGDGSTVYNRQIPVQTKNISNIYRIFSGYDNGYAMDINGNIWAWGKNSVGQLGIGYTTTYEKYPQKIYGFTAKDLGVGASYVVGLGKDGYVKTWGHNGFWQLGNEGQKTKAALAAL